MGLLVTWEVRLRSITCNTYIDFKDIKADRRDNAVAIAVKHMAEPENWKAVMHYEVRK